MAKRCRLFVFIVGLGLGLTAPTAAPAGDADAGQINRLIAQLGSLRHADRDAATQALDELGPCALAALRKAAQGPDAEVRTRARFLVQKIERRVENARLLEPRRVRLVCEGTPVADAIADLAKKTGFPIQLEGNKVGLAKRTVTLDTGEVSFWEALDRLCDKAGLVERLPGPGAGPQELDFDHSSRGRRLVAIDGEPRGYRAVKPTVPIALEEGPPRPLPTSLAGAFRVRALPPDTSVAGAARAKDETLVALEVKPEPHIYWLGVGSLRVTKAVDDQGQGLTQPQPFTAGSAFFPVEGADEIVIIWDGETELPSETFGGAWPLPVRLRLADKPSKRLAELHGTFTAHVQAAPEPLVTVDDVLKSAGRAVQGADGSGLKVLEALPEGGRLTLRVEVTAPPRELVLGGMPAKVVNINRGGWRGLAVGNVPVAPETVLAALALVDGDGRRLAPVRTQGKEGNGTGPTQEFTLVYELGTGRPEPAKLIYSGRRTAIVEVPFTLKDVPLP